MAAGMAVGQRVEQAVDKLMGRMRGAFGRVETRRKVRERAGYLRSLVVQRCAELSNCNGRPARK
jgi:hypothetical protein